MGRIDDNNEYVMMGEDPSGNPVPLKVDTVTGELLVNVQYEAGTPGTPAKQATVDDNSGYVTMAEDPDGNPVPLTLRTSDNRLYISSGSDVTAPSLSSWSIDLEADTLTMVFDESVDVSTLDVTVITLQDAATATISYTLTDSTTASADGSTIVIDLSATDLAAIRADAEICTSTSNAYITFTSAMIDDLAGNAVNAIADGSGQQATAVTYTFHPEDFSGLRLWLNADDGSTIATSGSNVTSWTDKSSLGTVYSQGTGSKQPTTGHTFDGRNYIFFDGTDSVAISDGTILVGTKGAAFALLRSPSTHLNSNQNTVATGSTSDRGYNNPIGYANDSGLFPRFNQRDDTSGPNSWRTNTAIPVNTTYVQGTVCDGSSTSIRIDGSDETLISVVGTNNGDWFAEVVNPNRTSIGILIINGEFSGFKGYIGEILIYDDVDWSDAKSELVEAYLGV